ncbi:sugar phosphate nucleotidyltransferase [Streptomyces sp. NPDC056938]|uniref:sugar phosphate nucleotidyltransferase n=1 Tax=unclassified Streptomyces TaxID=2593676 RepID=UPI0036432147
MEAILLVGGKGSRLYPITEHTPKPMVPTAGVPFLAHQLGRARAAGVDHVVLATSYLAEVFEPYFGDGADFGLRITYVHEAEPLGTGGAIRNAATALSCGPDEPVLVFNGDILTGLDIAALVEHHRVARADVSLHLTRVEDPSAFGLVPTDAAGRVLAFTEKPDRPEEIVTDQVNAGCYVFRRSVIATIPAGRPVSVERETFPGLLASGALLHGVVDQTYWLDLGRPAALIQASADLVRGVVPSPALPGRVGEYLILPGAHVDDGAKLLGGTVVGEGVHIAADAVVDGSIVLDGARIEAGAYVRSSLIGAGARVGSRTVLENAVIGDQAEIGGDNELLAGVRVRGRASIPDGTIRFSSKS